MADQSTVQIQTEEIRMKKSMNLLHCVAVLVAVTGHISIFISPGVIFSAAGSIGLTIIEWICAGLLNIGVCLCFVELATVFPSAGGPYAYVTNVFGGLSGFVIMWGCIILIVGPFWAYLTYTASVYILEPFFRIDCHPPALAVKFLGAWILCKHQQQSFVSIYIDLFFIIIAKVTTLVINNFKVGLDLLILLYFFCFFIV